MEKIKSAIIGLGRIASLLEEDSRREKPCTHAGAIAANADCVLVGGCDSDEERRGLFAERRGAAVYADAGEMIRAHSPQLLVIATHPDSHYHYCRLAADCRVPLVICEKPLADTLSAARKIAALEKRGMSIVTNHERRYSADYVRARDILDSGKLGPLLSVRAVLYMGKNKRLLDVFWHDGTHLADAAMFLTGSRLKHKKRWGAKLVSTTGTAWLEGELRRQQAAPVPFVMEIGAGRDHLVFELEFSSAEGRLRIGNGVFEVWQSGESPYAEQFRSLAKTSDTFEGPTGYFANMLADAVRCVREPGRKPVSSAANGLEVIEYLHSVRAWR
ncbi:MAG: Gfo/Idh/MocA family oxidoreductase [Treponema sp.]|nr:Gfo/Idh/MocA family oxidoreductase [Treponema sp.]